MYFPEEVNKIIEMIKNKTIPDSYPESLLSRFDPRIDNYGLRDIVIDHMGYALIANDWIVPLSLWIGDRNCLEVMSGSGALAYALMKQNIKIIPTDNFSGDDNFHYFWKEENKLWVEIEKIDAISAVTKYGRETDIVILSWPFMNNTATEVLKIMRSTNSDCIMLYIGEGRGGCTANSKFFDLAEPVEDKGFENAVKRFRQWNGVHDCRKQNALNVFGQIWLMLKFNGILTKDIKKYRFETFCYGPKSCKYYKIGRPRAVPYKNRGSALDNGYLDELCTEGRDENNSNYIVT